MHVIPVVSKEISKCPNPCKGKGEYTGLTTGCESTVLEKMYLQGPENLVKFYKGRGVSERNRKMDCVHYSWKWNVSTNIILIYVAIMGTTVSQTPQFGRIMSLFQHTFVKQTADWVMLDEYTNPMEDSDSNLWEVATNSPIISTVSFKKLSMPF